MQQFRGLNYTPLSMQGGNNKDFVYIGANEFLGGDNAPRCSKSAWTDRQRHICCRSSTQVYSYGHWLAIPATVVKARPVQIGQCRSHHGKLNKLKLSQDDRL